MNDDFVRGEEFREDLREPGSRNAQARKALNGQELSVLTRLSLPRSLLSIFTTFVLIGLALAWGLAWWGDATLPSMWVLMPVALMGVAQHSIFILSHEAAHYRLFANRKINDALGRMIGMLGGVSMCTYRVTHRLHHNNLYTNEDPDTAIHGGYPRGRIYLLKKLGQDILGLNAWKTFAYFFGSPAINDDTQRKITPLDDTSPSLRVQARRDRVWVVVFHVCAPLVAWLLGSWHGLFLYVVFWVLPLVTALQLILRLRAICEHGAVSDLSSPLTAARSNRTTGHWLNWLGRFFLFPHHVNYHLEHHLYPAVPHYYLPRLHALLQSKGVLVGAEVRDISETLAMIFSERKRQHVPI